LFKCKDKSTELILHFSKCELFSSGSGIVYSLFTCLGGLIGTYFYYIVIHEHVSKEKQPEKSWLLRRLSDLIHVPSVIVHAIFGVVLLGVAIGLEFAVPWKTDLPTDLLERGTVDPDEATGNFLGLVAWPPSATGAGVGLLQFCFLFFLEKSLGASSAFTVVAAQICRIEPIGKALPSLNSFAYGLKNYVAVLFALGAIGGSAISSGLSHTIPLGEEYGTNVLSSILGGFLLLVGARCAGGCTSGQGISGKKKSIFIFWKIDLFFVCLKELRIYYSARLLQRLRSSVVASYSVLVIN